MHDLITDLLLTNTDLELLTSFSIINTNFNNKNLAF